MELFIPFLIDLITVIVTYTACHKFNSKIKNQIIPTFILSGLFCLFLKQLEVGLFENDYRFLAPKLIAILFCLLPFSVKKEKRKITKETFQFSLYGILHILIQWTIGCGIYFSFEKKYHAGVLTLLPGGFIGGYGSSIGLSDYFSTRGWPESFDLLLASATLGFLISIVGGLLLIRLYGKSIKSFHEVKSKNINISHLEMDKIFFWGGLFSLFSFLLWKNISQSIPWFTYSYLLSLIISKFWNPLKSSRHELNLFSHGLTRVMVMSALISINIKTLLKLGTPLALGASISIIISLVLFKIVSKNNFRKALLTWGWTNGVISTALALSESLSDQDDSEEITNQFLSSYLILTTVEVGMLFLAPYMISIQGVDLLTTILLILICLSLLLSKRLSGTYIKV